MRRRWLQAAGAALVALTWLVAAPGPAHGCSCADVPLAAYADEMERAFVGTLASRTEHSHADDNGVSLTFDVERVHKGPVEPEIEVFTHAQESACGLDVSGRVGIVASLWKGRMHVNICSSPVAPAELEAVFGAGIAPPAGGRDLPVMPVALGGAAVAAATAALLWARRRAGGA